MLDHPTIPLSAKALDPKHPTLFTTIHKGDIERCLRANGLLNTRLMLQDPGHHIIGDPSMVRQRLHAVMPPPIHGTVADFVGFTYTPRTVSLLGSCGRSVANGAAAYKASDIVIAAVPSESLLRSGLPLVFCDRSPIRSDVRRTRQPQFDRLPWDIITESKFGKDIEFNKRLGYHAETLVYGMVPLGFVSFAVNSEAAASEFLGQAQAAGCSDLDVVVRNDLFFE